MIPLVEAETVTPIGPGTVRDMLTLRVMDTWSHEQDIRRALGRRILEHLAFLP